jgi:hypothetical protein
MADMPEPISNNAVVEGWANDTGYVYSFSGIDSTKIWSGISLKSFRYNTITDVWDTIPPLPDTMGKIAAAASYVDSIIYIIGGYHVLSNGNEISSNKVHRYDPRTNSYLSDGMDIPVPIDDHVQAVWNDSLIYIITGWSNSGNVPDVQIYDPLNDNWLTGTSVPNSNTYKAFGASGTIEGNEIFYHGGASTGFNFPAQPDLRHGQINPADPTQITWSASIPNNLIKSYRAACISVISMYWSINWLGGSDISYNYDGIAYNGSGGVQPKNRNIYSGFGNTTQLDTLPIFGETLPMDLRGIAGPYDFFPTFYIVGGMEENQVVSLKTLKLQHSFIWSINETTKLQFKLFPNPAFGQINLVFEKPEKRNISLMDILGNEVLSLDNSELHLQLDVSIYSKGIYFLRIETEKESSSQKIIIQ